MHQNLPHQTFENLSRDEAIALFEASIPASPEDMIGRWRGEGISTGHPMDGMLSSAYWYGKEFEDTDRVFPLIHAVPFWGEMRINPGLLPIGLVTALPLRVRLLPFLFPVVAPFVQTRHPKARLRSVTFRGRSHAAMIYDDLPIIDYFACLEPNHLLGWMDRRDDPAPFFFRLTREASLA